jgi:hypothetical protein
MSQPHLHQLMSEIGPLLDLDEVIEHAGEAVWVLALADGAVVEAEYDEAAGGRLLLSMELGEPAEAGAAELHRTLLQYNYLWRQTGGVRMALAGRVVVQGLELAVPGLDLSTLAAALTGLHGNAALWRDLLASSAAPDPQAGTAAPPDLHNLRA